MTRPLINSAKKNILDFQPSANPRTKALGDN